VLNWHYCRHRQRRLSAPSAPLVGTVIAETLRKESPQLAEKRSLVLLPGLLCTRALWGPQIEALSPFIDISVPDVAAHPSMAEIAAMVLAAAPERFDLAGLSMGGYVAFEILRQAPERVARVAFLDTSARTDTPEISARRRGLIELAQKGAFKGVTPKLIPMLIHPERIDDMVLTGQITAMAEDVGRDGFLRQQTAILARTDSRPHLADITCPTLVLVGRQDTLVPPDHAEEIAAGIAGANLVYIEDSAHLPTLEQPAETTAALRRWLEI